MTLKPHERRQNQAGPLRKKKSGRVPNGLNLDLHKDRLNHNNHQHHHSDQENNPRLAHTHTKKKKYLQKKHRPQWHAERPIWPDTNTHSLALPLGAVFSCLCEKCTQCDTAEEDTGPVLS
ncbi:hypothetical protein QQF64_002247 [Cirrhinus molitorella]|uniref:Uncharacterized protein n=1 Tax=Cirrhinus molitorella TaxID=172907 RepID=A0ABR3MPN0_9TELE